MKRRYGALLIIGEVQTGFGRTGKLFACEHYELEPDIITMAKSLAAGFPLIAVIGQADVMDAPDPGEIGGTCGGNLLSCVAGLKIIEKCRLRSYRIGPVGSLMMQRLKGMQEKYSAFGDVRGLGVMVAMELIKNRKNKEPAKELTS